MSSHTICHKALLSKRVCLSNLETGSNVEKNLQKLIAHQCEGKCINEGVVIRDSVRIVQVSAGKVVNGKIEFGVQYECLICLPIRDMILDDCVISSITKAGISSVYHVNNQPVLTVRIVRDNNYNNDDFNNIQQDAIGTKIKAKVIGCIYELNEKTITTICDLHSM